MVWRAPIRSTSGFAPCGAAKSKLHQRSHVQRGDELLEGDLEVLRAMRLALLAHLLLDLARQSRASIPCKRQPKPAAPARSGPESPARLRRGCDGRRRRLCSVVLRGALFIHALLRFLGLALALFAALLGFHHILTQLTVGAEQAAIGHYKFRFLLFFCHSFSLHSGCTNCTGCFKRPHASVRLKILATWRLAIPRNLTSRTSVPPCQFAYDRTEASSPWRSARQFARSRLPLHSLAADSRAPASCRRRETATRAALVISPTSLSFARTFVPGCGGSPCTSKPMNVRCTLPRARTRSTISCPM